MADDQTPDQQPVGSEPLDPIAAMVVVGVELHEMYISLYNAGFTKKEALYLVGQAVAAGVLLPTQDFGPDDFDELNITIIDDDDDDLDFDDGP
jgi:hypothetical protein